MRKKCIKHGPGPAGRCHEISYLQDPPIVIIPKTEPQLIILCTAKFIMLHEKSKVVKVNSHDWAVMVTHVQLWHDHYSSSPWDHQNSTRVGNLKAFKEIIVSPFCRMSHSHSPKLTKRFSDHNLPCREMFPGKLMGEACVTMFFHIVVIFFRFSPRSEQLIGETLAFCLGLSLFPSPFRPTTCTSPPNWLLSRNNLGFQPVSEFLEALEVNFCAKLCGRSRIDFSVSPRPRCGLLRQFHGKARKTSSTNEKLFHLPFSLRLLGA